MATPSRLDRARQQLRVARIGIGATAAAGLVVFSLVARASHPGAGSAATPASSSTASATDQSAQATDSFGFGSSSIAPSDDLPSVQSGGS
jgi:hypothetical protein